MKVSCPSCQSTLNIDDKKIPPTGARIKCPTCQNVFPVKPGMSSTPSGVVALPGQAAAPNRAVPLPGISAPKPQQAAWDDNEPTRAVPQSQAVPLPGITASRPAQIDYSDEPTRAGTPMSDVAEIPGASMSVAPPSNARRTTSGAVPLPGISAAPAASTAYNEEATRVGGMDQPAPAQPGVDFDIGDDFSAPPTQTQPARGGSIPLPGAASTVTTPPHQPRPAGNVPLPGGRAAAAPASSIPLPGSRASAPAPSSSSIPLPGGRGAAPSAGSIPLPGGRGAAPSAGSIPLPGAASRALAPEPPPGEPDPMEFDLGSSSASVPLPGSSARDFDFDSAPPPAEEFDPAPAAPAAAGGDFDFGSPPASSFDAPGSFDFGEAPAPAAAAEAAAGFDFPDVREIPQEQPVTGGGSFDFGAPPEPEPQAPAPDMSFDFNAPPAPEPAAQSFSFGEVDLGGGPPPPEPAGGANDLEFDPTAAPPRGDDLEADLSAPIPAPRPSGPSDGLEMLSFIDDTAKETGQKPDAPESVRRFHVKRRSGKVFGPFEEAVIVKMLEDGQLLGNEEVSLDAENWQPVGTEPAFQAVIAKLMEAPSRSGTMQNMPAVDEQKGPSMERLKQLYEGRMAAVAVVQGKEPVPFKKRLPFIAAGVAIAAVLFSGVFLGVATPYGFFALKLLFPAKVRPDTREFAYLAAAKAGFMADTWKDYNAARTSAGEALAIKEFPEARAVWSQAVFHLSRKYGKADPAEVATATGSLVNIKLLGEKHPEVLKTEASEALTRHQPDEALAKIADALARNSEDPESYFLRAEAYLQKKQFQPAKADYEQVLKKDPKSARALHALGLLARAQGDLAEAKSKFAAALEANPKHVSSAVELATSEIVGGKEIKDGKAHLELALADDAKGYLSSMETGTALALKAETLVVAGKLADATPLFDEAMKADPNNPFTQARYGRVLLQLHEPDKAVKLFGSASTAVPENLEYTEGYLSALITVGRLEEATKVVQQATTRFPGNAQLSYLSARVSDAKDDRKSAEEAYKQAIAADASISDAYLYLARLYMKSRRFAEAKPQLEKGLEQAENNVGLHVGMGELAFNERDLERADAEFKKSIELEPNSSEALLGLSRVALERGKPDLAEAQVTKALEINSHITGGKLQKGVALWKLGRLDDAIAVLEQAREDDPRNTQVTVTLGAVAYDKKDLDAALKYLNSALAGDKMHADGNFYMARVEDERRNFNQAIEAIKAAISSNGQNPLYHYWFGRILNDARKTEDAIGEWKVTLQLDPQNADALEAMGRVYFDRNDFKKAVKSYEEALKVDSSRNTIRALIGDAQMKLEDWDNAIVSYERALDADPEIKGAWAQMGLAYTEKKKPKKAIDAYTKAVKVDDKNAEAFRALGFLYKDAGKKKEAKAAFSKYLELRPEADDKKQIDEELAYLDQ
jgi:predicted Zn finger-like uncharacterized protein